MSTPKYIPLSEAELQAGRADLAIQYRMLLEHHISETAAHAAADRALVAQMAATIMSGSLASMSASLPYGLDVQGMAANLVRGTVHLAKLLLAEVDKK